MVEKTIKEDGVEVIKKVSVPLPIGVDLVPEGFSERIFLLNDKGTAITHDEPLGCLKRPVKVAYVSPGRCPPPASAADFWFDQVGSITSPGGVYSLPF